MKDDWVVTHLIPFCLAFFLADIANMALHEAGHALAARLAGKHVLSFGIGYRRLLLRLPIGGTVFYVCWPFSGGLTLWLPPSLDHPRTNISITAAGLVANILGLAAGILAWAQGSRSPLLAAWIAASALIVLRNAFPSRARSSGGVFRTDGWQLLLILRRRRALASAMPGVRLSNARAMIRLLGKVGQPLGVAVYHLEAAILEAAFANFGQARRDLDAGAAFADGRPPVVAQLEAVARLSVAADANDDQTPQLVEWARRAFPSVASVQGVVNCALAAWRRERDIPLGELGDAIKLAAEKAGPRLAGGAADLIGFLADPTDAPDVGCRELLADHPGMFAVNKAEALRAAAVRLVKLGRLDEARQFRQEACAEISREAGSIASPETWQAFAANWAERLQAVLPGEPIGAFVTPVSDAAQPGAVAKAATVALGLGVVSLLAGVCALAWGPWSKHGLSNIDFCFLVAGASFLGELFVGYHSVVRRERRIAVVLLGALCGALGVAAGVAAYMKG